MYWGLVGSVGTQEPEGVYVALGVIEGPLEDVGVLGLLGGVRGCQGCFGGLAGSVGTQGP